MKFGIMQPYLFPYPGYFQLIEYCEKWISFDTVQFIHKGWINRNRVLHPSPDKKWQYITIPLFQKKRNSLINQIDVVPDTDWRASIYGKLSTYAGTPYYKQTIEIIKECLDISSTKLSKIVFNSIVTLSKHLSIQTELLEYSSLEASTLNPTHPGEWAPLICEQQGASQYINPVGGKHLFKPVDFQSRKIELLFIEAGKAKYNQNFHDGFVENLSIIDMMMWTGKDETSQYVKNNFSVLDSQGVAIKIE